MAKKLLIAQVATAVIVGGQRIVIQPGGELPDLSEHDQRELLASGAAADPEVQRAQSAARVQADKNARADFEAARDKVRAERASIAEADENKSPPPPPPPPPPPAGKK